VSYPGGRARCRRGTVRIRVSGPGILRISIWRRTQRLASDVARPFSVVLSRRRATGAGGTALLRVRVTLTTGAVLTLRARVRFCALR
jgi:hypothetical protein